MNGSPSLTLCWLSSDELTFMRQVVGDLVRNKQAACDFLSEYILPEDLDCDRLQKEVISG